MRLPIIMWTVTSYVTKLHTWLRNLDCHTEGALFPRCIHFALR